MKYNDGFSNCCCPLYPPCGDKVIFKEKFGPMGTWPAAGPGGECRYYYDRYGNDRRAGTEASVTDTTGSPNHVLNFVIPRGFDGDSNDFCCFCVEQMRNIVEQIITLYPDSQLFISLKSGDAVIGTPGAITLGANGKSGIFELIPSQGNTRQLVSICSIDTITINNAAYNEQIVYLPEPEPLPTSCCVDCESVIRGALP